MKKIFLYLTVAVAFILTTECYSQVTLSGRDSITTLVETDIVPWMTNVGGSFLWRQQSWRILRDEVSDYLDDQSLTWTGINTFNGATFAAGAHGKVTFADTVSASAGLTVSGAALTANTADFSGDVTFAADVTVSGIPTDSTTVTTGQLWFNSTTGAIHRKF